MSPELVDGIPVEWALVLAPMLWVAWLFLSRGDRVAAQRARQAGKS